jgi:glycogen(starch) synthase
MNSHVQSGVQRVALFASAFHPSLGGVEELVRQLVVEYQRRGIEAVVVTNRWPRNLPAREEVNRARVLRYAFRLPDASMRSRIGFRLTSGRVLRELRFAMDRLRPDIIHVQCVSSNGWYASRMAQDLGVPLVVSTQGERTMDAQRIFQRSPVFNRVLFEVLRHAQAITACSRAALADLQAYAPACLERIRSQVVYNGIGREAFEERRGANEERPFFFALGRIVPQKGFHVLLEAFARSQVRDVDLILAGEGPEVPRLTSLVAELGLSGRVLLIGRAERARVHSLMARSVGVVVPSLMEPMGIVVLEALAAGKAVVASNVGGIPEILPNEPSVRLVQAGSVEDLAHALVWLRSFQKKPPIPEHIAHARKFCWESIAQQYLEIYAACAGKTEAGQIRESVASSSSPKGGDPVCSEV